MKTKVGTQRARTSVLRKHLSRETVEETDRPVKVDRIVLLKVEADEATSELVQ